MVTLFKFIQQGSQYRTKRSDDSSNTEDSNDHTASSASSGLCTLCTGTGHWPKDCKFIKTKCNKCKQIGHIEKACLSGTSGFKGELKRKSTHHIQYNTMMIIVMMITMMMIMIMSL